MPRNRTNHRARSSRNDLRNIAVGAAISGLVRFLLDQLRGLV